MHETIFFLFVVLKGCLHRNCG